MHLWTEYEGRTVAERYVLGKLLRSEGRNGFFATSDEKGQPAVLRLTEAHFDEAEQLRRWREVADVHQDNLIRIEQVGQTTLESVALTYALLEPDDANLGDVLQERPLTSAETLQVAKAVLLAVRALHASGLVHEHVEPANVFAVGETVKLRSDCARECVVDGEFTTSQECAVLRRRDIHDYGKLLLRCLTLETEWIPAHNNLPDPFKRVIPKALDGSWSLDQIGMALDPVLFAPVASGAPASTAASAPEIAPAGDAVRSPAAPAVAAAASEAAAPSPAPRGPLVPPGVLQGSDAEPRTSHVEPGSRPAAPPNNLPRSSTAHREPALPTRDRPYAEPIESAAPSRGLWIGIAVALLALLLLGWHFLGGKSTSAPAGTTNTVGNPATAPAPQVRKPAHSEAVPAATAPLAPERTLPDDEHIAAGAHGWHVIAFTYNHESQAASKVRALRRHHNSLDPQVFTPTGAAPFFVALGGAKPTQDEAEATYRHARRAGLPRDTFVRHY